MQRVAFSLHVKDGQQGEYCRRHQEVWPETLAELQEAGVHKMSIFLKGTELFVYMEVVNYDLAISILSNSHNSVRWEKYMAPIMESSAGDVYSLPDAYPDSFPEVFFWQESDIRHEVPQLRSEISNNTGPSGPHYSQLSIPPHRT